MIIKSIELRNFRNYENLDIHLDEGTNILYGDNAQGKTNILEAAYLSGTTKSHKGSRDKEMIRSVLSYRKKKKSTRLICILEKVDQKAWL